MVARDLRYPAGWPAQPAQEKGIDVALAVDVVMMAARREFDVGVLFSSDTDLVPVPAFRGQCGPGSAPAHRGGLARRGRRDRLRALIMSEVADLVGDLIAAEG